MRVRVRSGICAEFRPSTQEVEHKHDQGRVDRCGGEQGRHLEGGRGTTVDAFFEVVVLNAKKGDKVAWPGFGSFSTTRRAARTGRNPQTGAPVNVPASTAMKFSASSVLKAELNK